ncbi:MAG TPA: Hpt domain-containing protein, partial [Pinirhizobacter sp.]|uniref:chemotaxis protein CheA n=1 Tax=Pinirhizobacter sp. TaxID=2950432 RepID=UPI002BC10B18
MAKVDLAQFHRAFFDESNEGLAAMEAALLALDAGSDDGELIHTIFRAAHSIKGGAATFGFADVAAFTHVAESLLEEVRSGRRAIDAAAVELLLRSVDVVRVMLERSSAGMPAADAESEALRSALAAMVGGAVAATAGPAKAAAAGVAGWDIAFRPFDYLLKTGNEPLRMFRELAALGSLEIVASLDALPALAAMDAESAYVSWQLTLHGDIPRAKVDAVFDWVDGDCELTVAERKSASPAVPPVAQPTSAAGTSDAPRAVREVAANPDAQSIRVGTEKIDLLINMVGELVITQSMLSQFADGVDASGLEQFRAGLAMLARNTRELQESVMGIRMLPISHVFNRFPRLARDLSQKLDKKVSLDIRGETTELDKSVLEKIGDPLVHLVRNAIDHGLESTARRREAGKNETGTLRLEAFHRGGSIVVEVADDGAG